MSKELLVSKHLEAIKSIEMERGVIQSSKSNTSNAAADITIEQMRKFAEWIRMRNFTISDVNGEWFYYDTDGRYTTSQLVELYLNQLK